MSYDQYGIKAGIEGTFDTGRYITEKVDIETVVTGAFSLVKTGVPSFTGQIPSTADIPNYDTDGLTATVLATATRCDQETGRSYFVSFLRGGSCNKPGAAPLASAIFYDNTTSQMAAEDVQAAIDELDGRMDLIADTDDQTASEVVSQAHGSINATNVQSAINEIADQKLDEANINIPNDSAIDVEIQIRQRINGATVSTNNDYIEAATSLIAGVMTAADKAKLDSVIVNYMGVFQSIGDLDTAFPTGSNGDWAIVLNAAGPAQHHSWDDNSSSWEAVDFASITGQTNLSYSSSATQGTITSDTGSDAIILTSTHNQVGLMSIIDTLQTQSERSTVTRSDRDIEGIYTTITYTRQDSTKIKTSILSGGTPPLYTTRTTLLYDENENPVHTEIFALTYDSNEFISEVLQ